MLLDSGRFFLEHRQEVRRIDAAGQHRLDFSIQVSQRLVEFFPRPSHASISASR
jgi:hypothetical protein